MTIADFEEYKKIVNKYAEIDTREINFQNRVVLPFIEKILSKCPNISVEDVSTQYKNKESDTHTRVHYAGIHTPDLLVVKDWNYNNKDKNSYDYIAVIEIKSPVLAPISKVTAHTKEEIEDYLERCNKVILTDCYVWEFYEKGKNENESIVLFTNNEWVPITQNPNSEKVSEWKELENKLSAFLSCE